MARLETSSESAASRHPRIIRDVLALDTSSTVAIIGHPLHTMLVHFPIALVFATLGCDLLYWYTGDGFWQRAGLRCSPVWWGATAARGQGTPHGYNASQYRRGHGSAQRQSPSAGAVRPPSFRP